MSCIELLRHWGYEVNDTDRLAIADVMKAADNGTLEEVFGTGTAAVISPVGQLYYQSRECVVGDGKTGEVTQKLYDTMTGIQYGRLEDTHGWIVKV